MRKVSRAQAMDGIAGYSVSVDYTARDYFFPKDYFFKSDFLRGKGQDGTNPLGPVITPARFIGDPHDLRITLSVNGAVKQDASTAGMIYRIDEQLSSISQFVTLEPGDVVLTGSPATIPALVFDQFAAAVRKTMNGDRIEITQVEVERCTELPACAFDFEL